MGALQQSGQVNVRREEIEREVAYERVSWWFEAELLRGNILPESRYPDNPVRPIIAF